MGVGAGIYMYDVVVKKFTFAISSPRQFLDKRSPNGRPNMELVFLVTAYICTHIYAVSRNINNYCTFLDYAMLQLFVFTLSVIMVALRNRADHYIFAL